MPFSIFKGEKTISELVNRLFNITGPTAQSQAKQATDALLKANPQLKDLGKVSPGTPIVIPNTAPPLRPEEVAAAPDSTRNFATQNIQTAFEYLMQRLDEIDTTTVENIKSSMARLQAQEIESAIKTADDQQFGLRDLVPEFASMTADFNAMLKEFEAATKPRAQAMTDLRAALDSFARIQRNTSGQNMP